MKSTFKQRLQSAPAVLAPGIYDALTALVAEQAGFEALYLSGASIPYTRLGRSDVGLTTATEVADTLARITERVALPVIVDGDTGFGNALNTQRTVRAFERAGAAMDRAEAYLECGVDALFIEALRTPEQMRAACERFAGRIPLLANMVEGGKTPVTAASELGRIGFRMVIFPGGTARAVAHTLQRYFASLRRHETTAPERERMLDFDQLNALIGTPELLQHAARYDAARQDRPKESS